MSKTFRNCESYRHIDDTIMRLCKEHTTYNKQGVEVKVCCSFHRGEMILIKDPNYTQIITVSLRDLSIDLGGEELVIDIQSSPERERVVSACINFPKVSYI